MSEIKFTPWTAKNIGGRCTLIVRGEVGLSDCANVQ